MITIDTQDDLQEMLEFLHGELSRLVVFLAFWVQRNSEVLCIYKVPFICETRVYNQNSFYYFENKIKIRRWAASKCDWDPAERVQTLAK